VHATIRSPSKVVPGPIVPVSSQPIAPVAPFLAADAFDFPARVLEHAGEMAFGPAGIGLILTAAAPATLGLSLIAAPFIILGLAVLRAAHD
jgi:hypothetical protein